MKCLNGKCSQGYDDCCRDCKERPHCTDACSFATDKDCEERYEPRHDMWKFAIEKRFAKNRFLISYRQNNSKGEKMCIELMKCEPLEVWQKSKSVPADLKEYWFINVYIKDRRNVEKFGNNPMILNGSVHFRWVLEATEENAVLLLKECEKRFHAEDDI